MGLLSQEKTAAFLQRATSDREVEDILSAYIFSKYASGSSSAQVLRKLHLLTLYLRAVNLGGLVVNHYSAFALVAYDLKEHSGDNIGATPPQTELGLECWNTARRPSASLFRRRSEEGALMLALKAPARRPTRARANTDGAVNMARSTNASAESSENEGDNWGQRGPGAVRAVRMNRGVTGESRTLGNRTRSDSELARRIAGSGAREGLGSGLLSAPPTYWDEEDEDALPCYVPRGAPEAITVPVA